MQNQFISSSKSFLFVMGVSAVLLAAILSILILQQNFGPSVVPFPIVKQSPLSSEDLEVKGIAQFTSEEEFQEYLSEAESLGSTGFGTVVSDFAQVELAREAAFDGAPVPLAAPGIGGGAEKIERVSGTNVQVQGIDEPDIVKTDGEEIYFSPQQAYYGFIEPLPFESEAFRYPSYEPPKVKAIQAFPPSDLALDSEIENAGTLLLVEDILIVFSGQTIKGYDISDPESPAEEWNVTLEGNTSLVTARLQNGTVYLVTQNWIDRSNPCPIVPLRVKGSPIQIPCRDVFYPITPIPVDVTFTAMAVNPANGEIQESISFVGPSRSSVISMFPDSLYVTYTFSEGQFAILIDFLTTDARDLFPANLVKRLETVRDLDISEQAKAVEMQVLVDEFERTLDDDDELLLSNEVRNRLQGYSAKNKRKFTTTGIVKIGLEELDIVATGEIPGQPLNQFALDEWQGNLRIATTVGNAFGFWFGFGFGGGQESENDVYVLNADLETIGSVQGLGLDERIFAARFIEDKGYLVTFRQIDPFYVLDLSDPTNPEVKGELKIPGFSSYLHQIEADRILGVGREDSNVKLSIFDVSDATNPEESAKYLLDEYWTDVSNTHHAFLLDSKHEIFFLPGGQGGYIFSFADNTLKLQKAISDTGVRRAIFINDYLYVIGDSKITVWDENTWEKESELVF